MKDIIFMYYAYATDFIKMWLILWGILKFKPVKNKNINLLVGILTCILLFLIGLIHIKHDDIASFLSTFMVILNISFIFQGKYFKKLAYSLLSYVLILFLDACIIGISSLVANMSGHEIVNYLFMPYIYNSINIFTILFILLLMKSKAKSRVQIHISKRIFILLFSGALTGTIILAALLTKSNDVRSENIRRIIVVVTIIAIISYNVACIMMIIITESRDNYRTISMISQSIIESQQKYYTLVNEKQQEMRSIRHEMKNHLACIHGLYNANKLPEMERYIKQLIDASDLSEMLFDTGNDIVNAILNDAQSKYKRDNIILRLDGGFPSDLHISPMDLCIIFANTVSNAVEAIQRMERAAGSIHYIDIRIKSFKDDLFIVIKNPVGDNTPININKLVTTKQNKDLHGFGVKNVIQSVEKYHGTVNYRNIINEIFVEIEMKNRV